MNQKITKNLYSFFGNEYQNNAFLLINNDNNECVVIDPSTYANEITLFIRENKLTLRGILLTHGHYDHYSSDEVLVNNFETKIYCPLKEKNVILNHNFSKEIVGELKIINENNYVFFEGKELIVGTFVFNVLETPGHTKGSVCYK